LPPDPSLSEQLLLQPPFLFDLETFPFVVPWALLLEQEIF
jgi:hypothetical protein